MPYKRGGGKTGVIIGCHHNQKKLYDWEKAHCLLHEDCPCLQSFSMHCIPKNAERREAWIYAINRKNFDPKNKDQVCSIHFLDGRPTEHTPNPVLHLGYKIDVKPGRRKFTRVPLFPISTECNKPCPTTEDFLTFSNQEYESPSDGHRESTNVQSSNHFSQTEPVICHFAEEKCPCVKTTCDSSTQTENFVTIEHCYAMLGPKTKCVGIQHSSQLGVDLINTDSEARFYTGLTCAVIFSLVHTLSEFGKKSPYILPIPDQILLTIISLRLGLAFKDLGNRFGISFQLCSSIFSSWINIMHNHLRNCALWLPRECFYKNNLCY